MSLEKRIGLKFFTRELGRKELRSLGSSSSREVENETQPHISTPEAASTTKRASSESSSDECEDPKPISESSKSEKESGKAPCILCGRRDESEWVAGELRHDPVSGITVHLFCMYFAPGMKQEGDEEDVLVGFSVADIRKEQRRGMRLRCSFCKKVGAVVGCCNARCRKKFHLPCGRERNTFHEFFGGFKSFCEEHVPEMPIEIKAKKRVSSRHRGVFYGSSMVECALCYDYVPAREKRVVLWTTCCINASFHFKCVQTYALKAGAYHVSCPMCRNVEQFQKDILANGVYLPERDAAWENTGEFDCLLARPDICVAPKCYCPMGEKYNSLKKKTAKSVDRKWSLKICDTCGSKACHAFCSLHSDFGRLAGDGSGKDETACWTCNECISTDHDSEPKRKKMRRSK